jgi:hypothetical protein
MKTDRELATGRTLTLRSPSDHTDAPPDGVPAVGSRSAWLGRAERAHGMLVRTVLKTITKWQAKMCSSCWTGTLSA